MTNELSFLALQEFIEKCQGFAKHPDCFSVGVSNVDEICDDCMQIFVREAQLLPAIAYDYIMQGLEGIANGE